MTVPSAAIYGGMPAAVATAPVGGVDDGGHNAGPIKAGSATPTGWHQNPVLLLVIFLGIGFLLARGAEHGISFGFTTKARVK